MAAKVREMLHRLGNCIQNWRKRRNRRIGGHAPFPGYVVIRIRAFDDIPDAAFRTPYGYILFPIAIVIPWNGNIRR
jgi:hypothetical protein